MLEEEVLEKLRRLALVKYCGRPEEVRDYECQSHYFLYMWDREHIDEEFTFREVKAKVIDMWFEGNFEMKEKITFADLYRARGQGCEEEDEAAESYTPPPETKDSTRYIS